ncbi:MAG: hypothetical protein ACYDHY_18345 [Acidiferrobacterales bacterium]
MPKPIGLQGHLVAIEPLTVTTPESNGYLPGYNGRAYIPSSTMRHHVRANALRAVRDALAASGKLLSPQTTLALIEGYAPEIQKKTSALTWDEEILLRARNPFLSLFGIWKLPARLSVGNAYTPVSVDKAFQFVRLRANMARKLPSEEDILECGGMPAHITAKCAIAEADRAEKKRKKEANSEEGKGDEENQKAKGSVHSIASIVSGWSEIVPGTLLDWRLTVFDSRESFSLPLLVAGLRRLADQPWLGGHRAAGCGHFGVFLQAVGDEESVIEINEDVGFHASGLFQSAIDRFDGAAKSGFPEYDFSVTP